jgi:septal ring factor EnvC (AmiA/AmiB activator)
MRRGLTAGAASAVLALLFLSAAAEATPSLRDVERRRAAAEADRKRLESEAKSSDAAIAALNRRRDAAAEARAQAEAEVAALERAAGRLGEAERRAADAATRTTVALERVLVTLSLPDADRESAALARVAGQALAPRAVQHESIALRTHGERQDIAVKRADLAVAQARLDSARAALDAAILEQQARRALLNADLSRAGRRESALAEQARNLRALVARTTRGPRTATAATPVRPAAGAGAATRLVAGATIQRRFGARLTRGTAEGLTLRTASGAQVLAPSAAKVAWAGPFRSYGSVLILDPGGDYAIVLAGMERILVREGQAVQAGRPVAEMSLDATAAPELYVEVRRGGDPVDPVPWLNGAR